MRMTDCASEQYFFWTSPAQMIMCPFPPWIQGGTVAFHLNLLVKLLSSERNIRLSTWQGFRTINYLPKSMWGWWRYES